MSDPQRLAILLDLYLPDGTPNVPRAKQIAECLARMTLRDWFAGQALPLYEDRVDMTFENVATAAYAVADAMLVQREKEA